MNARAGDSFYDSIGPHSPDAEVVTVGDVDIARCVDRDIAGRAQQRSVRGPAVSPEAEDALQSRERRDVSSWANAENFVPQRYGNVEVTRRTERHSGKRLRRLEAGACKEANLTVADAKDVPWSRDRVEVSVRAEGEALRKAHTGGFCVAGNPCSQRAAVTRDNFHDAVFAYLHYHRVLRIDKVQFTLGRELDVQQEQRQRRSHGRLAVIVEEEIRAGYGRNDASLVETG